MRLMRRMLVAVIVVSTVGVGGERVTSADSTVWDGMPDQAWVDQAASPGDGAGRWGDALGGAAGRPFVTNLSVTVTEPDGTVHAQTFITDGTVETRGSEIPGDITMTISPYNLCNKSKAPSSSQNQCYSSPNRLGASIAYVKNEHGLGYNFSNPTDNGGAPMSTPLLDLIKNPANVTTFDATVNMNTWGKSLRWSWLNGIPTFWNVANLGAPDAVLHLKFNLATGPDVLCNTAIPVMGCDPAEAASRGGGVFAPHAILKTDFVLSLDNTGVDPVFSGTLFASSNADMGSLEAVPVGSPTLGLTYGVSGASELDGRTNEANFYAFVSDASLLNYFGVTQDVLNLAEFASSETLKVQRADGGVDGAQKWTRWTAADNGTSGYFFSVSGVKFNGKAVVAKGVSASAQKTTKPAKFVMGRKVTNTVLVSKFGSRQLLRMNSASSLCKKSQCRWVVAKSTSKFKAKTTKLATVPASRSMAYASTIVAAKKGTLLSAVLQAKVKGKWRFVTSRMVVAK